LFSLTMGVFPVVAVAVFAGLYFSVIHTTVQECEDLSKKNVSFCPFP
jgi:hypothetical protein